MTPNKLSGSHILTFLLGGNATFTMRSEKTGTRFTYKITAPKNSDKDTSTTFWVKVLTGYNNETDYTYIGFMRHKQGRWSFTAKEQTEAQSTIAFTWYFNNYIAAGLEHPKVEVWHEGKCCRCGRKLTVPESIESGIGPECSKVKKSKSVTV